jgi:hypothetical protein
MFQLIKTELSYNQKYIIIGIVFCSMFLFAFAMSGKIEKEEIQYSTLAIAFWMFFFARWGYYIFNKDNLERVHASLPLPLNRIAIARVVAGLILWYSFITLTIIALLLTSSINYSVVRAILFLNGLALTVNSFVFVWHDFVFIKPSKIKKRFAYLFYYIFTFFIISVVYLSTATTFQELSSVQESARDIFFQPVWIITTNGAGLIMLLLNYLMYPIRSSYLQSEFGLKSNIKVKTGDVT